jgi:deazaflavin-dependent oxidoreductase (nitroreductase family)
MDGASRTVLAEAGQARVTTIGCRSGRPHSVVVWFALDGDDLVALAHARDHGRGTDWYRNLMAVGHARVEVGILTLTVSPVPIQGPVAVVAIVALLEAKYGVGAVTSWYKPDARVPVRLRVGARG